MRTTNITADQITEALATVNKEHGYELTFNREPERKGKWLHFTIKSARSGIPGSRYSHSGRKLVSASWHAHGYLFEEMIRISPACIIKTGLHGSITVDAGGGNWQDANVGSLFAPAMLSELSIRS